MGLFDGNLTLRKDGSPANVQRLELHEFDSDSQYSSASGVSHGRKVRLTPLGGSEKSNSPTLTGSQFSNPHHAYHPSASHYTGSLSGGGSVASSVAASIKQMENNLSKNLGAILTASAEKAQAEEQSAQRTGHGKKKKKKRVRGSSLILESIIDSRPGTAGEGEGHILSRSPSRQAMSTPLSKGELSAQDLFGGNNSDDADMRETMSQKGR